MTAKVPRKYAPLWERIKQELNSEVALTHAEALTEAQREKCLKTIRKAVSKEKYMDFRFKDKFPNAEVDSELDASTGTIRFRLTLDPTDCSKLF